MSFGVTVENDQQMAEYIHNLPPKIFAQVKQLVDNAAVRVAERAREIVVVRTGHLQASIEVDPTGGEGAVEGQGNEAFTPAAVIAGADYAAFVEGGTNRMAPRPFMAPALEEVQGEMALELDAILQGNGLVRADPGTDEGTPGGNALILGLAVLGGATLAAAAYRPEQPKSTKSKSGRSRRRRR